MTVCGTPTKRADALYFLPLTFISSFINCDLFFNGTNEPSKDISPIYTLTPSTVPLFIVRFSFLTPSPVSTDIKSFDTIFLS